MATRIILTGRVYHAPRKSRPYEVKFIVRDAPKDVQVGDEIALNFLMKLVDSRDVQLPQVSARRWRGKQLDLICANVSPFFLKKLATISTKLAGKEESHLGDPPVRYVHPAVVWE